LTNDICVKVKIGRHLSSEFKLIMVCDYETQLLISVQTAIRRFKAETHGTICDKFSQFTAYSDNVVVMGNR